MRAAAFILAWTAILPVHCYAQDEERVVVRLLREAAVETASFVREGSVRLTVVPDDAHPIVAQVFSEELMNRQHGIVTGSAKADNVLTIDVRGINSSTALLDNSSYLRTVSVQAGVVVEWTKADTILWSREYTFQRTDTLQGIPPYERKEFTAAEKDSVLDSVLAPVAAGAAAIVIVVLLFTIRGS